MIIALCIVTLVSLFVMSVGVTAIGDLQERLRGAQTAREALEDRVAEMEMENLELTNRLNRATSQMFRYSYEAALQRGRRARAEMNEDLLNRHPGTATMVYGTGPVPATSAKKGKVSK